MIAALPTRIRLGRCLVDAPQTAVVGQPMMVSYGMGVDSTAMLVWLHEAGIRPDVITFADTGSEKPETYAYLPVIQAWCAKVGFPQITVIKNRSKKYDSLEANCLTNSTLPSLAFGMKGCSLKWKVEPMETWANSWMPAQMYWARGGKCLKLIGYDASPADCRRSKIGADDKYDYMYPLRDNGITRDVCKQMIERAGLPIPPKSACWFCPASKHAEVVALAEQHPDLARRALELEAKAKAKGLRSTKGLGRNWNWGEYLATAHPALLARLAATDTTGTEEHAMAKAFKPSADAERVLKDAHAAGLISTQEVGKILLLAIDGDVTAFNQQMSALARKLEGARS